MSKKKDALYPGLSTGSTLLNLACSGSPTWGFRQGCYYFLVGDSASGKTFLSLTCLAEATLNPAFADHRFLFDNAEEGALMDIRRFFGQAVADRLEPPDKDKHGPVYSETVEQFYFHLDDAFTAGKPFIYVLDSMDSLSTEEEGEKFAERKKAARKGREVSGSYGTAKAKANSAGIRRSIPRLRETGSILIVISQTRDNIGFGAMFNPKTRSGGHALRFYATLELWSSVKGRLKKTVRGKERQTGIVSHVQVKKNRLTGRERSVELPIYHSRGIDDVGSCVDWLITEGHWNKDKGGIVHAPEFRYKGSVESLIRKVEEAGRENELRLLVAEVWQEIEDACEVERKPRYT